MAPIKRKREENDSKVPTPTTPQPTPSTAAANATLSLARPPKAKLKVQVSGSSAQVLNRGHTATGLAPTPNPRQRPTTKSAAVPKVAETPDEESDEEELPPVKRSRTKLNTLKTSARGSLNPAAMIMPVLANMSGTGGLVPSVAHPDQATTGAQVAAQNSAPSGTAAPLVIPAGQYPYAPDAVEFPQAHAAYMNEVRGLEVQAQFDPVTSTSACTLLIRHVINDYIFLGYSQTECIPRYNKQGGKVTREAAISKAVMFNVSTWFTEQGVVRPWKALREADRVRLKELGLGPEHFPIVPPRVQSGTLASQARAQTQQVAPQATQPQTTLLGGAHQVHSVGSKPGRTAKSKHATGIRNIPAKIPTTNNIGLATAELSAQDSDADFDPMEVDQVVNTVEAQEDGSSEGSDDGSDLTSSGSANDASDDADKRSESDTGEEVDFRDWIMKHDRLEHDPELVSKE